jgi:hypothetical protein
MHTRPCARISRVAKQGRTQPPPPAAPHRPQGPMRVGAAHPEKALRSAGRGPRIHAGRPVKGLGGWPQSTTQRPPNVQICRRAPAAHAGASGAPANQSRGGHCMPKDGMEGGPIATLPGAVELGLAGLPWRRDRGGPAARVGLAVPCKRWAPMVPGRHALVPKACPTTQPCTGAITAQTTPAQPAHTHRNSRGATTQAGSSRGTGPAAAQSGWGFARGRRPGHRGPLGTICSSMFVVAC